MVVCATNREKWESIENEIFRSISEEDFDEEFRIRLQERDVSSSRLSNTQTFLFYFKNHNIGYASVYIFPRNAEWSSFYPINNVPECTELGIATRAHDGVLLGLEMIGVNKDYTISHSTALIPRETHLRKRGIDPVKPYSFAEYKKLSFEYSARKREEFGGLEITCEQIILPETYRAKEQPIEL